MRSQSAFSSSASSRRIPFFLPVGAAVLGLALSPVSGNAQWTNRYPKVAGYGHHVYLEGYELPVLTAGPIDPAPSPDGERVAFASHGWIWVMDLASGVARRLTRGGGIDARPAWSPDGELVAFVRDDTEDTEIVWVAANGGAELGGVDSPGVELDPAFSADGTKIFYSSAESEAGALDLWAVDIESGERRPVTDAPGIELKPQPGERALVYLWKGGGRDRVVVRSGDSPEPRTLIEGSIASMARPALSPDGSTVAVNWPTQEGWDLRLLNVADPGPSILLASGGLPLTPAWGPSGEWVYFAEADDRERLNLKRVRAAGGPVEAVEVTAWDWGAATASLRIRTVTEEGGAPVAARLAVVDGAGHPLVPDGPAARFDGQSGRVFFYSPGVIELTVPVGEVRVSAVQGLATPESSTTVQVAAASGVAEVEVVLSPVWDARASGWSSGEHHFHLNYGGPYDLSPDDLTPMMLGEALDFATPLLANLHNRFEDQELWTWRQSGGPPFIRFGQEVRSHFLGHLGLIEIDDLFWPWVWGPGYQVYGSDDRANAEPLRHARAQGGFQYYVHPVSTRGMARATPWAEASIADLYGSVPVELVPDAVLGDLDALEIVCLWSDEVLTSQIWHLLLNAGIPIVPSAGTDVMNNFYRTMAIGTSRVYAQTGTVENWSNYMDALRSGRTFVTNGPFLEFSVGGAGPGHVVSAGDVSWSLDVATATEVDRIEVLVNGEVAWSGEGLGGPGSRRFEGDLTLPEGGWVAARAVGGPARWPMMANYPFAHTAPVWIGSVGSSDPAARRAAVGELLAILGVARLRLIAGYGGTDIPNLLGRFDAARERLEALAAR
ncbi:CehA/McbA family metallohydrolase [Candidatus Palauibacter sp.]|uniref:CehA/McbA family metallohydrolase n=1 Tax=Candidatus Palauibacter sp. TaxID=3101350 RepID=UPI003B52CAEC